MTRFARLGVAVNPTAGHGRGKKYGPRVLAQLVKAGYEVINLSCVDAETTLARAREERDNYDALVVVGGDGMAHLGINVVAGTATPLGIIPAGSGNDLARHLRLPLRDATAAVSTLRQALEQGPESIDAIALMFDPSRSWPTSGFDSSRCWVGGVVSAGFDSVVNARANTYAWPPGIGRYLRGVIRELRTFEPYKYRVRIDGEEFAFDGALIALANTPSFGGGMRIAPDARGNNGFMDVVIATDVTRVELLRVFPRIFNGSHLNHPAVRVLRAREVHITPQDGATIPHIFADGEFVGNAPVTARVHPGAVRMLCPKLGV